MAMSKTLRCLKYRTIWVVVITYVLILIGSMVAWLPPGYQSEDLDQSISEGPIADQNQHTNTHVDGDSGIHKRCVFEGTFEDNLHKLRSLPFTKSTTLMDELGFSRVPTNVPNASLPVLVTGINSLFYGVVQGLVKTVHKQLLPKYPDLKFIIYDMGMNDWQFNKVAAHCRCEVRKMSFDKLPEHVLTLGNFAFKPIIANYVFQEFGNVWWVDSSVRFISNDLEEPLTYLQENGALFFTYAPVLNIALHTHRDTFHHFQEEPCPYMHFGEVEAGNVAFVNTEVGRTILNRWVSCALDASCITPEGAQKGCKSPAVMSEEHIGKCHRYDQSALSVILRRLYHDQNDYPLVNEPFRIIKVIRRQVVNYFPLGD